MCHWVARAWRRQTSRLFAWERLALAAALAALLALNTYNLVQSARKLQYAQDNPSSITEAVVMPSIPPFQLLLCPVRLLGTKLFLNNISCYFGPLTPAFLDDHRRAYLDLPGFSYDCAQASRSEPYPPPRARNGTRGQPRNLTYTLDTGSLEVNWPCFSVSMPELRRTDEVYLIQGFGGALVAAPRFDWQKVEQGFAHTASIQSSGRATLKLSVHVSDASAIGGSVERELLGETELIDVSVDGSWLVKLVGSSDINWEQMYVRWYHAYDLWDLFSSCAGVLSLSVTVFVFFFPAVPLVVHARVCRLRALACCDAPDADAEDRRRLVVLDPARADAGATCSVAVGGIVNAGAWGERRREAERERPLLQAAAAGALE